MPDSAALASQFAAAMAERAPALLAALGLLCLSAVNSGCETALFSLSPPEMNRIRAGKGRLDRVIAGLHADLKRLLPSILFCNMAVNVLIYALTASVAASLGRRFGAGAELLASASGLSLVVFFGEVFPKRFAISSSMFAARLTSLPVWFCHRLLLRPMWILNWLVGACERVIGYGRPAEARLQEEELRLLVELSKADGVISGDEYELIDGIVDLPEVRIRDVMVPRIDVQPIPAGAGLARAVRAARECRHCKLPVVAGGRDEIVGWLDVQDIFAECGGEPGDLPEDGRSGRRDTVAAYLREFRFFSEHDRADQVLERIKGGREELFAVVDERGQLAGYFTMRDLMDEVLGRFGEHGAAPPEEVRAFENGYVISGRLSIREWRDLFNVSESLPRSSTVGGLMASLLGRVPRAGDAVRIANMEMTVLSGHRNRVAEVGLRLIEPDPPAADGAGEG